MTEKRNYHCECSKALIPQEELPRHLKLHKYHKISKANPSIQSSKDYQNSIFARIEVILKIQTDLQLSSVNLIKTITINADLSINKLSKLINMYKKIISDRNHDKQLQNKEIISNFTIDNRLKVSLIEHFGQEMIKEKWSLDAKITTMKEKILKLFNNKYSAFKCLAVFSTEKFIVTGGLDGFIRIWDLKNNTQSYCLQKYKGDVLSLAIGSRDEIVLAGYGDCAVRLWDLKTKKMIHKFTGHNNYVKSVLISDDNKFGYSASWDMDIKIWDLEKMEIRKTITMQFHINQICLIDNQKTLVAVGTNGYIGFWNKVDGVTKINMKKNKLIIECCCFSSDESQIILGNKEGSIQILFLSDFKIIFEEKAHTQEISCISVSSNSQHFATSSYDNSVKIWDLNKKFLVHFLQFEHPIERVAFLKNSDNLVICQKYPKIVYFDLKKCKNKEKIFHKHLFDVELAISSNLKYICYLGSTLSLYCLETEKKISKISRLSPFYNNIKFSPDSSYLICGTISGEVLILSIPNLSKAKHFTIYSSKIVCVAISSYNKYIAIASEEKKLFIKLIELNQNIYFEPNVFLESAIFCYNDKRFVYSVKPFSVHVLDENFKKVKILNFGYMTYRLICSEDDQSFIVSDTQAFWSCVNAKTSVKIFENKTRKNYRELSAQKKDSHWKIFVNLIGINF